MLKVGICLIGFSLGVALFVPRDRGGLVAVVGLLTMGMVFVVISPRLRTDDAPTVFSPEPGPQGIPASGESELRNSSIRPGRHSKDDALGDPEESAAEPGQ